MWTLTEKVPNVCKDLQLDWLDNLVYLKYKQNLACYNC